MCDSKKLPHWSHTTTANLRSSWKGRTLMSFLSFLLYLHTKTHILLVKTIRMLKFKGKPFFINEHVAN